MVLMLLPLRAQEPVKIQEPIAGIWVLPGTYYKEVRDFKILNPATVSFAHLGGKITVRFDKLEPKWRDVLGYDRKVADAYEADLAAKEAEKARLILAMAETAEKLAQKIEERAKLDEEIEKTRQQKIRAQNEEILRIQLEERMALWRIYGHDLGEYVYRQRGIRQREQDLQNAMKARYMKYGR